MQEGDDHILKTDVDQFLELVTERGKVSIQEVAKLMKTSVETVQAWADFLVEEKVIGMEYKFTTPYVYIIRDKKKDVDVTYIGYDTKEEFYDKARKRGVPEELIKVLWQKYLKSNIKQIQEAFFKKTKERGIDDLQANRLWIRYINYLEE